MTGHAGSGFVVKLKLVPQRRAVAGCPSLQLTRVAVRPASRSWSVVGFADNDPPWKVHVTVPPVQLVYVRVTVPFASTPPTSNDAGTWKGTGPDGVIVEAVVWGMLGPLTAALSVGWLDRWRFTADGGIVPVVQPVLHLPPCQSCRRFLQSRCRLFHHLRPSRPAGWGTPAPNSSRRSTV